MSGESIESFLAKNVSSAMDREFYAIGFGSNFFNQFTNAATAIEGQLSNIQQKTNEEIPTKKKSCQRKRTNDKSVESHSSEKKHYEIPNAFIFPVHLLGDGESSSEIALSNCFDSSNQSKNKLSASQKIRRLMKWRRNSRGIDDFKQTGRNNSIQDFKQSFNSLDSKNENKTPVTFTGAGMTHNAMLINGEIYITGTFHGKVYESATIQRPKHQVKCTQISCGKRHLLALFQNKTVMSMGMGYFGQLGHGNDKVQCKELTVIDRLSPRHVHGEVVCIEAGGMHSAAIVTKDISSWRNKKNLKNIETKVYFWGSNKCGECPIESSKGSSVISTPTQMINVRHPETGQKVSFVKLAWGKLHCVGLSHHGHVYSWGSSGRCGHGDFNVSGAIRKSALKNRNASAISLPRRIEALRNSKIIQISAGDAHTLVLSESGRVFSWGSNSYGQLGFGHSMQILSPRFVADLQFGPCTKGPMITKEALSQEALHWSQQSENKVSHPSSSTNSSIDLSTTVGDIHYPSTPQKKQSRKLLSQSSKANDAPPFINAIHATGTYSTAISSSGDLYTWGCSSGDQLGHYQSKSFVGNHKTPSGPTFQVKNKSLRIQDSKSFDSKFNIFIPKRVECLRNLGLRVEKISTSPNFMVVICSKIEPNDMAAVNIGKTLFEIEKEKHMNGTDRIRLKRNCGSVA